MPAYIVAFKKPEDEVSATDEHISEVAEDVKSKGGSIKHLYTSKIMRGFAGEFSDEHRKELEKNPAIKYIEPDGGVSI